MKEEVAMDEMVTTEEASYTPALSPAPSTQLNCGYGCSKYIYNQPITRSAYDALTKDDREFIKGEYYKSYDYMTGIRTAEFLGGAILLFSLFVLYKMKCRPGRGRKMSVATIKMTPENSSTAANMLSAHELTSSPDIILSEPANDKDSGCQNGSASANFSRQSSMRLDMAAKPVTFTRLDGKRLSCGNINGPPSLLLTDSLLRPSSFQCMSLSLQQPFSFCRRPVHRKASDRSNELIDIQIIQATPNASPRGSIRRLSEDTGHLQPRLSPSRLSMPKSQSCLQTALSSSFVAAGRTSRGTPVKPRRLSLSPGDCYLNSNHTQNLELIGNCSYRVIPNLPSTPTFGQQSLSSASLTSSLASSTPSVPIDLLQGPVTLSKRRFSTRSAVDDVAVVHKSPCVRRRASTACHVSWLPVASRQTTGLPLDVNCVLLERDDTNISETRC